MSRPSAVLCLAALLGSYSVRPEPSQPPDCGGRYETAEFQLTSPGFPNSYPRDVTCEFEIAAASASVCGLDVDFGTLALPLCPSDRLVVAGRPVCGPNNRRVHVPFLESPVNITFRGSSGEVAAFNVTVRQVECGRQYVGGDCGGEFSEDTVVIQSPGYPSGYPGGLDCRYSITAADPSVCSVELAFTDSALESSPNCFKDSLTLGTHRMCGPLEGVVLVGMEKMFNITFTTDDYINDKGFRMTVRQKRCSNLVDEQLGSNEKQDVMVFGPPTQSGNPNFNSDQGYPIVEAPFPPFPFPDNWNEQDTSQNNFPPNNVEVQIPIEQEPPINPPFRQNPPTRTFYDCILEPPFYNQYDKFPSSEYLPAVQSVPASTFPQNDPSSKWNYNPQIDEPIPPAIAQNGPSDTPVEIAPVQPQLPARFPSYPPPPSPSARPIVYSAKQCCAVVYSDSHFLIASPDFPRTQSSDCIYTLSRFSTSTNQLRLQFKYFLVGEDTGRGCSGGYLEIDGTRVCGCRTGTIWTIQFAEAETAKIIHLKTGPAINSLINGFIIEVVQEDSYSQKFKRVIRDEASNRRRRWVNVNQYVETTVERKPLVASGWNYPYQGHLVWDPSYQSWRLQNEVTCLQWNLQNWVDLAKTALWSKYQCPSSTDAARTVTTTSCRTCQYFCRQNCQCCRRN